jgi:ATP-dependent HslUV protease subunit HslV
VTTERLIRSTTILTVRRAGAVVVAGDGQVSFGNTVMKRGAKKVRRLGEAASGGAIAGFAGSAADGLALFERLDGKLREHRGNLRRAAVDLAKDWRSDKALRRLEAMLLVADREGPSCCRGRATSSSPTTASPRSARAGRSRWPRPGRWRAHRAVGARDRRGGDGIAADICIYTNGNLTVEELS